jgi:hypothetical protein
MVESYHETKFIACGYLYVIIEGICVLIFYRGVVREIFDFLFFEFYKEVYDD